VYDVIDYLNIQLGRIEELKTQAQNYLRYQDMFKVELSRFDELEVTYYDINLKKTLWQSLNEWQTLREEWNNTPFESIDADSINSKVQYYTKIVSLV
jgi:hypothetical protein